MRPNGISRWLRAGAIGFAVLALAASALEVSREGGGSAGPATSEAARDPLAAELERCNAVTPTGPRDEACERSWAENRRRFLGAPTHSSAAPASIGGQP